MVTYTFKVVDAAGNELTNQTYSHTGKETTVPTGATTAGSTGNTDCFSSVAANYDFDAVAAAGGYTDNCGGTVTAVETGTEVITGSDAAGWMVTYTFKVVDAAGNELTNQTYSHTGKETTAPTGATTAGSTGNTECFSAVAAAYSFDAVAAAGGYTDNCGGTVTAVETGTEIITGSDALGWTVTYTFKVVDAAGNELTGQTYSHTGKETTAPTITCPATVTANTNNDGTGNCTTTVSLGTPTAVDNCTTAGNFTFIAKVGGVIIDSSIYLFGTGNTTVVWTATDQAGNVSVPCNQTVTVADNENPMVTAAADVVTTTSADGTGNCTVSRPITNATYADNCTVTKLTWEMTGVTTASSPTTGINQVGTKLFNIGVTTITYIVTDGSGRTSTDSMTVTVTDDENPTIICPSAQNESFGANCEFILLDYTALAIASDNCSSPIITQSPASGTAISGQTTVTLTATDSANNTSTCSFEVIPTDNESPIALCKDITVDLSPTGTVNISALDLDNGSTDNCGIVLRTVSPNSFNCGDVGDNTVIFTVKDDEGHEASCTATVTVVDNTPPIMLCNNFVVVVDPITRVATINVSDVDNGSNDACGIASLTVSPSVFPEDTNGDFYTTTTTLTAVDVNGNTSTCNPFVTVEPPVNQNTYLTGVIIDPVPTYPQPPSALVEATSCPGGLYDPKDVKFTLEAIGGYNLQASDVIHWEYSEDNGETWIEIPGTSGQLSYRLNNIIKNTFVRLSITNAVTGSVQSSATAFVRFLPPDEPPIIVSNSSLNICLGESVTVVAESFFDQQEGQFGEGGKFNYAQPDGWRVDGLDGEFPASGNNTSAPTWKETNSVANPNKTFSGINYDTSDNTKFAIAHSVSNNQVTTLETPVFSTVGMTASEAILSFHQGYYFCGDASGTIELSFNSGNTYGITLTTYSNSTTGVSLLGNTCSKEYPMADPFEETLINLGAYVGNAGLRIKFTFDSGADGGFCNDVSFPKDPTNGCNKNQLYDVGSGWAIDDVGFAFSQVDDELEWTDEGGTVIAVGTTATVTPVTPGIRRYGVTTLINGCRTGDDSGTNFIDITTSLAYAGEDYLPVAGNCGEATLQLNAYDNTKKAIENFNKGAWKNNLYVVPADASQDFDGTGVTGVWSIEESTLTSTCGSSATFSSDTDPDAIFTGNPGTYKLRWTLTNGCSDEIDVKISDCNSLDFDGANDYVTFKDNYNLNSDFSIETWIKPISVTGTRTIFSRKDAGDNASGYDLSIVDGQVRFNWYYNTGSGSVTSSSYSIDTSRWYHLAVTFDGSRYKLYFDGIELGSVNDSNPPNITGNKIEALLGAMYQVSSGVPVNYYHGWVEEFKIWNKALSVEHIRQMMNQEIDELGADVGGVQIPTKIYGPDNDNNGTEDNILQWSNLDAYYHMNIICGDLTPYKKGVNGRLRNITTGQQQTAPIPYTTKVNGNWTDTSASTPWTYGNSIWDYPNSTGINGDPIDWNIVKISHDINSGNKDITVLGLLLDTSDKLLTIANAGQPLDENNPGQGLWITHYLKLNGNIDLVGESQLVQKRYGTYDSFDNFSTTQFSESIFDAASTGYLERDQQGQKNSFNYNYWSSPVSAQGGVANNELYSIKDVLKDGTNSALPKLITFGDGAYFADGSNGTNIKISNRWIWSYNDLINGNAWDDYYQWRYIGSTLPLNAGEGFTMKGTGGTAPITTMQNYVFVGKPHSGAMLLNMVKNKSYLIGNPYPSALDADEFILDNIKATIEVNGVDKVGRNTKNIFNGALYFWDHFGLSNTHLLAGYIGGYATYTLMGGVEGIANDPLTVHDGSTGSKKPSRFIPVGQGFFIDGTIDPILTETVTVDDGDLVLKNSQRIFKREATGTSVFMKGIKAKGTATTSSKYVDSRPKIKLQFNSPLGYRRVLLVGVDERTTNIFDIGFDAPLNEDNKEDMFWLIGKGKLVIQGVNNFNEDQELPLGLKISEAGLATIKIDELKNMDENIVLFIKDKFTGKTHNISHQPFEIELEPGTYLDRFSLIFRMFKLIEDDVASGVLLVEPPIEDNNYHVFMNNAIAELQIKNNGTDEIKSIALFNNLGQTMKIWNTELNRRIISLPVKLATGVYIVQINTIKGTINKRIIIE
jgi:hypothetical protein